jgi:protein involved in polysaccharide export with SLBB domain
MRYGYRLVIETVEFLILLVLLVFGLVSSGIAKEYQVGSEDVLTVTFWQDPSLNASVRVSQDGKITLDVIGQIDAAGKTTTELQDEIIRLMSRLNKNISQAVVRVSAYNYNYVFVNGQVRTPGKKTFEEIPDLWSVINESGGPTDVGDLTQVTIIRGGDQAGKVEVVNVSRAIAEGRADKLPRLRRGDAIDIPASVGNVPTSSASMAQQTELKNLVYVIGAANRPGPVTYQDNIDFTDVLALAGGPTANADLKHIKILSKDGYYTQTYQFNMETYAKTGKPARYILRKEDTFIIPERQAGFLGAGLNIGTIAAVVGVVTSIYLLYDRLNQNNQTTNRSTTALQSVR